VKTIVLPVFKAEKEPVYFRLEKRWYVECEPEPEPVEYTEFEIRSIAVDFDFASISTNKIEKSMFVDVLKSMQKMSGK
jgi:hypothetical protein